jgi:hypothetical protein
MSARSLGWQMTSDNRVNPDRGQAAGSSEPFVSEINLAKMQEMQRERIVLASFLSHKR